MELEIPGSGKIVIKNIVCDFNGTLAVGGSLISGVDSLINELSKDFNFYVITADTFGTAQAQLKHVNCQFSILPQNDQQQAKYDFIRNLGCEETAALGNGRNDLLMLKHAVVGIAVLESEGIYSELAQASDVLCKSIIDGLSLFQYPLRLVATLRS